LNEIECIRHWWYSGSRRMPFDLGMVKTERLTTWRVLSGSISIRAACGFERSVEKRLDLPLLSPAPSVRLVFGNATDRINRFDVGSRSAADRRNELVDQQVVGTGHEQGTRGSRRGRRRVERLRSRTWPPHNRSTASRRRHPKALQGACEPPSPRCRPPKIIDRDAKTRPGAGARRADRKSSGKRDLR